MNPLNKDLFYKGFPKQLAAVISSEQVEEIWSEAGVEYQRMLREQPELKKHKGAMVMPAVALYRVLAAHGLDAEKLLNEYGEHMGKRFARIVHGLTGIPGVSRLIWKNAGALAARMSSEGMGYKRRLVSDPPKMYGVDILSCPYHELAKEFGIEKAVLCICHMDKEYSQGFRKIQYDRNSALPEGADCCEYRLRWDERKDENERN